MQGRRIFIIALIVVSVVAVFALPFLSDARPEAMQFRAREENRIAVIKLQGTIQESMAGFLGGGISPSVVRSQLERVAEDASIEGVVLRIESPGGSIAASQEISAIISEFEKPIVVSMADMAASGGYYISAPAQGIVAQAGTMTGSIGVISTTLDLEGLYEKLGIEVEVFKSGEHKDMLSREMTEEEREIMQGISDEAYNQFIEDVARYRDMDIDKVRELATGQLYLGSQAKELGLVDRLGGVDEAVEYLAELNDLAAPVRYELPPPSLFTQLFGYGYGVMDLLEKALLGPELIMLEKVREGFPPDIRYQVR